MWAVFIGELKAAVNFTESCVRGLTCVKLTADLNATHAET